MSSPSDCILFVLNIQEYTAYNKHCLSVGHYHPRHAIETLVSPENPACFQSIKIIKLTILTT